MDRPKPEPNAAPFIHAHPTTESAAASSTAPELAGLLTHEDVDRALDRWQVSQARREGRGSKRFGGLRVLWLLIGPGILVFLGENDAPSMLSYSADGARYGIGFFIPFCHPDLRNGIYRAGNDGTLRSRHTPGVTPN